MSLKNRNQSICLAVMRIPRKVSIMSCWPIYVPCVWKAEMVFLRTFWIGGLAELVSSG